MEREDLGVLHHAGADFDGVMDGPILVPRRRAAHHRAQIRDQSLADAPGGAVPQIRRAVIYTVVGDAVAHGQHRFREACGLGEREPHAGVTGHVNDQAAWGELSQLRIRDEHQRRIGVLQHAVDHNVVPSQELGRGHLPRGRLDHGVAGVGCAPDQVVEHNRWHRGGNCRDVSHGQRSDVVHT